MHSGTCRQFMELQVVKEEAREAADEGEESGL